VSVTNPANQYIMLANPLDNGTNDLVGLLPNAATGAQVYVFQGGSLQGALKSKGTWSPNFIVPPGTGFFYNNPNAATNTFVGSVAGMSNGIPLVNGVTVLAGSPIPFSGSLNDQGTNTLNLGSLPNGSQVYMLTNGTLQGSLKSKGSWNPNFPVNVAAGFYITPGGTTNLVQILNLQ